MVNVPLLFPRLDRSDGVAEVAVHQALIADVIHGLGQQDGPIEHLFADERWLLVKSSAPRRSWLSVLNRNGFPCEREVEGPCRIDPVIDLTEIGQFADAARGQLMALVLWLAPSIRPCRTVDADIVDRGPLAWAPSDWRPRMLSSTQAVWGQRRKPTVCGR